MCLLGRCRAARSKAPTGKCVSVGSRSLSQVKFDQHLAQNPRCTPGNEPNLVISPLVTTWAARANAAKNRRTAVPPTTLALGPRHPFRPTGGRKTHRAAHAATLE